MVAITAKQQPARLRLALDRREVMGPIFIAPAIIYVIALIGIPFLLAIYYGVSAYTIFNPSYNFVGVRNILDVVESDIFQRTLINTFIFTISAQVIALVLGKFAALLLLRDFPGRRFARALIILPWAVPISLSTLAWKWMFDSLYSVINWTLEAAGLVDVAHAPQW
ncbi:MAG TPA: sugar ABC transporter permease, partial [Alphaproteobacteria bacterium]|nr:sugar ABC transporter permease [Alphaproteobacteria bacterium]